jgi:hypothetical protein
VLAESKVNTVAESHLKRLEGGIKRFREFYVEEVVDHHVEVRATRGTIVFETYAREGEFEIGYKLRHHLSTTLWIQETPGSSPAPKDREGMPGGLQD